MNKNNKETILETCNGRIVKLQHKFLNNEFIDDCWNYYKDKCKLNNNVPNNTYFIAQAVKEYIIDKDVDPIYEDEEYTNPYVQTCIEKLFA